MRSSGKIKWSPWTRRCEIFRGKRSVAAEPRQGSPEISFLNMAGPPREFSGGAERQIGFALDPAEIEEIPADVHRDPPWRHRQKQSGFSTSAPCFARRITPAQLRKVADLPIDTATATFARPSSKYSAHQYSRSARCITRHELNVAGLPVFPFRLLRAALLPDWL